MGTYRVFGQLTFAGRQGSNSGQPCWTISSNNAPYVKVVEELGEKGTPYAKYIARLRFNSTNGTKGIEFMASPKDFDVHRPALGNMAYVVRGPHRKTLVKIAELIRDGKKVVTGFKVKLEPFQGRSRAIIVDAKDITKLEPLPDNEQKDLATYQLYDEEFEEPEGQVTRRVHFDTLYPDY